MAPRGGSGSGALPATSALVRGQTVPLRVPAPPPSTPSMMSLPAAGLSPITYPSPTGAAAPARLNRDGASSPTAPHASPNGGPGGASPDTGPVTIAENPSSSPWNFIGNSPDGGASPRPSNIILSTRLTTTKVPSSSPTGTSSQAWAARWTCGHR